MSFSSAANCSLGGIWISLSFHILKAFIVHLFTQPDRVIQKLPVGFAVPAALANLGSTGTIAIAASLPAIIPGPIMP